MYCKNCGALLPHNARVCTQCGRVIGDNAVFDDNFTPPSQIGSLNIVPGIAISRRGQNVQIHVDDQYVGNIRGRNPRTMTLAPGSHEISLMIDTDEISSLVVFIKPGETTHIFF